MLANLQPTKEQVRAYMQQRQREFCNRPAPAPKASASPPGGADHAGPVSSSTTLFLPGMIAQLTTLLVVEWCFLAAGAGRPG
jgi:hypothetical protein